MAIKIQSSHIDIVICFIAAYFPRFIPYQRWVSTYIEPITIKVNIRISVTLIDEYFKITEDLIYVVQNNAVIRHEGAQSLPPILYELYT